MPSEAYPKTESADQKALELDDTLVETHCSLGFFRMLYDWNFPEAEKQFKRAIELSPNYPNAHDCYGFYLKAIGRHVEAIKQCKIVQQLDPLSPFSHISLGYGYYFASDFDKAIEECHKALEIDKHSTFAYGLWDLLTCKNAKWKTQQEAFEVLKKLQEVAKERYVPAYNFAVIYLGLGRLDETFEWFEKAFEERSGFMPFLNVKPIVDSLTSVRHKN